MSSSPSIPPSPPAPPPSPSLGDPTVQAARDAQKRRLALLYGRRATMLTGAGGVQGGAILGAPSLLGEGK